MLAVGLRALVWGLLSGAILAAGLYGVGVGFVAWQGPEGISGLGSVQRAALHALYTAILLQALLPQAGFALGFWLAAIFFVPSLDASWRRLVPGLAAAAALGFPLASSRFAIWRPTGPRDVIHTFLLMTGSVLLALLVPRVLPNLLPGSLRRENFLKIQ